MKDFYALKVISTIFRLLGIINIVITVGTLIIMLIGSSIPILQQFNILSGTGWAGFISTIIFIFLSLLPCLLFFAISEIILLFLQIEKNTRKDMQVQNTISPTINTDNTVNSDFQEWKKNNPHKSINDYYQSKR